MRLPIIIDENWLQRVNQPAAFALGYIVKTWLKTSAGVTYKELAAITGSQRTARRVGEALLNAGLAIEEGRPALIRPAPELDEWLQEIEMKFLF